MPGLHVNKIFRCLMTVSDREGELQCLSTEWAEVFGQLEDDGDRRIQFCADDSARVIPLFVRRVLAWRVFKLLSLSLPDASRCISIPSLWYILNDAERGEWR